MSFITFYTRVQIFANIYKYSAMKGANRKREELRELASHSRGMLKKWTGGVILIIWVLSDDPGLWDVLGNNTILYGVLHRLDSDEHQIRLLCSLDPSLLGPLDTASDVISCLMSGQGSSYKSYNHPIRVWSILVTWRIMMVGVSQCHSGPWWTRRNVKMLKCRLIPINDSVWGGLNKKMKGLSFVTFNHLKKPCSVTEPRWIFQSPPLEYFLCNSHVCWCVLMFLSDGRSLSW